MIMIITFFIIFFQEAPQAAIALSAKMQQTGSGYEHLVFVRVTEPRCVVEVS